MVGWGGGLRWVCECQSTSFESFSHDQDSERLDSQSQLPLSLLAVLTLSLMYIPLDQIEGQME